MRCGLHVGVLVSAVVVSACSGGGGQPAPTTAAPVTPTAPSSPAPSTTAPFDPYAPFTVVSASELIDGATEARVLRVWRSGDEVKVRVLLPAAGCARAVSSPALTRHSGVWYAEVFSGLTAAQTTIVGDCVGLPPLQAVLDATAPAGIVAHDLVGSWMPTADQRGWQADVTDVDDPTMVAGADVAVPVPALDLPRLLPRGMPAVPGRVPPFPLPLEPHRDHQAPWTTYLVDASGNPAVRAARVTIGDRIDTPVAMEHDRDWTRVSRSLDDRTSVVAEGYRVDDAFLTAVVAAARPGPDPASLALGGPLAGWIVLAEGRPTERVEPLERLGPLDYYLVDDVVMRATASSPVALAEMATRRGVSSEATNVQGNVGLVASEDGITTVAWFAAPGVLARLTGRLDAVERLEDLAATVHAADADETGLAGNGWGTLGAVSVDGCDAPLRAYAGWGGSYDPHVDLRRVLIVNPGPARCRISGIAGATLETADGTRTAMSVGDDDVISLAPPIPAPGDITPVDLAPGAAASFSIAWSDRAGTCPGSLLTFTLPGQADASHLEPVATTACPATTLVVWPVVAGDHGV